MTCQLCTGSRWLADNRALGPCVCAPTVTLICGDSLHQLVALDDNSVDSVVCDPPYGLSTEPDMLEVLRHWLAGDDYEHDGAGFMGKTWDSFVPGPAVWREVLRVLRPGGHVLAFFGTRTQDMGVLAIRLAGFEIRDSIGWLYGSGFPKNSDVERLVAMRQCGAAGRHFMRTLPVNLQPDDHICEPTADGDEWGGWGTALKPAMEPIVLARKPLGERTVAANVLRWGVGALNIDGCRVHAGDSGPRTYTSARTAPGATQDATGQRHLEGVSYEGQTADGRWPANVIHDGSDEVVAVFPHTVSGGGPAVGTPRDTNIVYGEHQPSTTVPYGRNEGSAARFFYCAKASTRDREEGLEDAAKIAGEWFQTANGTSGEPSSIAANRPARKPRANNHPTVKPTALMAYLVRLVTPPGGTVLDPFMGSGSTGKAAFREGFHFVGIDLDPEYVELARRRITG